MLLCLKEELCFCWPVQNSGPPSFRGSKGGETQYLNRLGLAGSSLLKHPASCLLPPAKAAEQLRMSASSPALQTPYAPSRSALPKEMAGEQSRLDEPCFSQSTAPPGSSQSHQEALCTAVVFALRYPSNMSPLPLSFTPSKLSP